MSELVEHLDRMAMGYMQAALWADCEPLVGNENGGMEHLITPPALMASAMVHCAMYYMNNRKPCDEYLSSIVADYDPWEMLGHDLRMMEGGHGVGPVDRKGITPEIASALRASVPLRCYECYELVPGIATIDF